MEASANVMELIMPVETLGIVVAITAATAYARLAASTAQYASLKRMLVSFVALDASARNGLVQLVIAFAIKRWYHDTIIWLFFFMVSTSKNKPEFKFVVCNFIADDNNGYRTNANKVPKSG